MSGNLPSEVTSFVGRRTELASAKRGLETSRMMTLHGVGGVGKTRLALRLASDVKRAFGDGVWLVELSALREPELVPRVVAEALQLPGQTSRHPIELLAEQLADRHMLLILDTCEHLLDACAMLAETLLRAAPQLRILATSREPLNIFGEHVFPVSPLETLSTTGTPDSVVLFSERVRSVLPGFAAAESPDVARLCQRLDGIPLAIELAVVRLRSMTLPQLVERIDDRFGVLGTGRPSRSRHQTLRDTIGWSHELCQDDERLLWSRLSVFPGAFDLEAAEQICGDDALPEVFDTLTRLVEKSIVTWERGASRYRMLDTLRDYGAEQLPGPADALRRRHRDYFLDLVQRASATFKGGEGQLGLLNDLRAEMPNLRAAFDWSLSTPGEETAGLRMITGLSEFWVEATLLGEGRDWTERGLSLVREPGLGRGWGLHLAGRLSALQGDSAASFAHLDEAMAIAESLGEPLFTGHVLHVRGLATFWGGDVQGSREPFERAIAIFREAGFNNPHALACLAQLANVHSIAGDFETAIALCDECIELATARSDGLCLSFALYCRALSRFLAGDSPAALRDLDASLELKERSEDQFGIALDIDLTAFCAVSLGQLERAALLIGITDELWRTLHKPTLGVEYAALREYSCVVAKQALGDQAYANALRRGASLSLHQAIATARGRTPAAGPSGETALLGKRELEIAQLIGEGLTNKEIATRLVLAKRTVDAHVEHVMSKLGCTSRTEIAGWVRRRS